MKQQTTNTGFTHPIPLRVILLVALICLTIFSYGQGRGRDYIREQIRIRGECRNVAITQYNGDLMLYGNNGYAASGCPQGLIDAIRDLHNKSEYIDDVQLTEQGRYLILYGNNGFVWNDIPYSLECELRKYNNNNEVVLSVTFNDVGNWVIISRDYYTSSDASINQWLKDGAEIYGMLWSVCLTNDAIVAVYSGGYRFFGEVPYSLKTALEKTKLNVYRLKIAGNAWFFADNDGNYHYNM